MNLLHRSVAVLIVALFTAISTAVILARQQLLFMPERLDVLHLNMCEPPCWIGITPGQTTLNEAIRKINSVYFLPSHRVIVHGSAFRKDSIDVEIFRDKKTIVKAELHILEDQTVHEITFNLEFGADYIGSSPTYADIYMLLGTPSKLRLFATQVTDMLYFFDEGTVSATSHAENFNMLYRAARNLTFLSSNVQVDYPGTATVNWQGFKSTLKYVSLLCIEQSKFRITLVDGIISCR